MKRKGVLLEQSNHTITYLPAGRSQATVISEKDWDNKTHCSRWKQSNKMPEHTKMAEHKEVPTSGNESDSTKTLCTDKQTPQMDNQTKLGERRDKTRRNSQQR